MLMERTLKWHNQPCPSHCAPVVNVPLKHHRVGIWELQYINHIGHLVFVICSLTDFKKPRFGLNETLSGDFPLILQYTIAKLRTGETVNCRLHDT